MLFVSSSSSVRSSSSAATTRCSSSSSSSSSPSSSLTFRRSHHHQERHHHHHHQRRLKRTRTKKTKECHALFTGIVQGTATVTAFTPIQGGLFARLTLTFPSLGENQRPLEKLTIGASIAVNGTCLTVVEFDEDKSTASFDMISETLRATNLGELRRHESGNR